MRPKILLSKKGLDPDLTDSAIGSVVVLIVFLIFFAIYLGLDHSYTSQAEQGKISLQRDYELVDLVNSFMEYNDLSVAELLGTLSENELSHANQNFNIGRFDPGVCCHIDICTYDEGGILAAHALKALARKNRWELNVFEISGSGLRRGRNVCTVKKGVVYEYDNPDNYVRISPSIIIIPTMNPEKNLEMELKVGYV